MSVQYMPVIWNRNKFIYDGVLIVGVVLYLFLYIRVGPLHQDVTRPIDGAILRMRAALSSKSSFAASAAPGISPTSSVSRITAPMALRYCTAHTRLNAVMMMRAAP